MMTGVEASVKSIEQAAHNESVPLMVIFSPMND